MTLEQLVDTENDTVESLLQTYTTVPIEKIERVQADIIKDLTPLLEVHIESMWLPEEPAEAYKPYILKTLPASVRSVIVEKLDQEYPEKEILLKFHQYSVICNTYIDFVVQEYKRKFNHRIDELGVATINVKDN